MKEEIQEIMREITSWDKPSIFRVTLSKTDHTTFWGAYALTRGADSHEYSASGESAIDALVELKRILKSLVCPVCGKVKDD